ncbi:MAG TPA: lactate racemase domain-containing protein [Terriglobales bacterium]
MAVLSKRAPERELTRDEIQQLIAGVASALNIANKRVLILIPDGTRTLPMPLMFRLLQEEVGTRASACDYLIALGTHQPMSEEQIGRLLGSPLVNGRCGSARVFNHRWDLAETFAPRWGNYCRSSAQHLWRAAFGSNPQQD